MQDARGEAVASAVLERAGLGHYRAALPTEMVPEQEVIRLQQALRAELGVDEARPIARDAGRRTGDYLLANRIPRPAQALLKRLPAKLASRALLKAIHGSSWTFVGTGVFRADPSFPPRITIDDSLLCRGFQSTQPVCDFYAGTFERLFRELVHPDVVVTEVACAAAGSPACVFEIAW